VEDELLVAFHVQDTVEAAGFHVDGPYVSVSEAILALEKQLPACAILDVQLTDGEVYPVANALRDAGVPVIFHSGHADAFALQSQYPEALICGKPCSPSELKETITALIV
jgi:DNA-binding response OmpR family regulator